MFSITLDRISLKQIAGSGQCFRWKALGDGRWAVPVYGAVFELEQISPGEVRVRTDAALRAEALMRAYLDAETDYGAIFAEIDPDDAYLIAAARAGRGIRILRQPLWETTASFIISQNNNIPRIRSIIARLCGGELAPFPPAERVAEMDETQLRAIGCGYRAGYLLHAARQFADGDDARLPAMDRMDARAHLVSYKGIGEKVADCICLYGLGHKDAFPADVWVKRILASHYPQGFSQRTSRFAGVYQQVMFEYERSRAMPAGKAGGHAREA